MFLPVAFSTAPGRVHTGVGVVWRHDVMADVNRSAQFLKSEPEGASSVIPPRSQTQRFIRVINIKAVLD